MDWLSPFAKVQYPQSVKDDIMGFCLPSSSSSVDRTVDLELSTISSNNNTSNNNNNTLHIV